MRISNLSLGVCASVLLASAAHAEGGERQFGALDDSPRFMLYVTRQIGVPSHSSHSKMGPSFGFAVERETPLRLHTDSLSMQPASVRIFDLRYAPFQGRALFVNGMQLTGEAQPGLGFGSYGSDPWKNPWLWGGIGLAAALGISCATDNWPCDDGGGYNGSNSDYQVPGT